MSVTQAPDGAEQTLGEPPPRPGAAGRWGGRLARLRGSRLVGGLGILTGGTALAQLAQLASTPVLTRLYPPGDFGVLAVYSSVLGILTVVASLRYPYAIHLPRSSVRARRLLRLSLASAAVFCLVLAALAPFLARPVAGWLEIGHAYRLLWLLPASVLGAAAYQAYLQWTTRNRDYRLLAGTTVRQSVGQVVTQIGLGLLGARPAGLVLGYVVGQVAGVGTLARAGRPARRRVRRPDRLRRVLRLYAALAHRYRRFPLLHLGSSLLINLALYLPAVLLASLYGVAVAGVFALTQKVMAVPMRLVGQAVAQVYVGEAARLMRGDRERLRRLHAKAAAVLAATALCVIAPVALAAPWLMTLAFGPAWTEAGTYLRLLAPMMVAQFAVSPLSQNAFLAERQDLELWISLLRVVLVVGAFWGAAQAGWGATVSVGLFSAAMTVCYLLYFLLNRRVVGT